MRSRRKLKKALRSKGFTEKRKGRDHDYFFFDHEGLVQPVFTKVSRGVTYRDIDRSLLGRMSRQLHLDRGEFDDLIDCPMSADRYIGVLVAKKVIRTKPTTEA